MRMATGAALSGMQLPAGKSLYGATSDISDFFYWLVLPEMLRRFFALPAVRTAVLERRGALSPEQRTAGRASIRPRMRVCPMGWSWAFWFAQRAHLHMVLTSTGISPDRVVEEGRDSNFGRVLRRLARPGHR